MCAILRIALLECDELVGDLKKEYGSIGNLYKIFLEAAAVKLEGSGLHERPILDISSYDVVNKQEYPDVENIDSVFLTGSRSNDWILKLVAFTKAILQDQRVRIIAVCFGHQIVGRAFGIMPERNHAGWEVSVTHVALTERGSKFSDKNHLPETNKHLTQPEKVVLITGAGRGIGRSMALQYAHAGVASIIICSRTMSELKEVESSIQAIDRSIRVHTYTVDVTSESAVKECASAVYSNEGRLDILINNAGGSAAWTPLGDSDPKEWWRTFETNLQGPYHFLHAFLPLLVRTAKENDAVVDVINVASVGALEVLPGASAYEISKLALLRLNEFVEAEYSGLGVNTVAIHPGGVVTRLSEQELEELGDFLTDTADLAGGWAVWFTKGARTWLNGRYACVNWNVDWLEQMKDEIVEGGRLKVNLVM
ncbi:hypothetical protein CFE70_007159 [Pyrenophora teres f. teres 0-1]